VGNGEFNQPRGIAVDAAGGFYVVEKANNRVQQFDPRGRFVRRWGHNGGDGTPGLADGELNFPYNAAIDGAGDLYVTDTLNHRVQKYTPDGRYLARWGRNGGDGSLGDRLGEFHEPYGIAADCTGSVYVSEEGNNRVQKLGEPDAAAPRCPPVLEASARAGRRGIVAELACDQPCTAAMTLRAAGRRTVSGGHELLPGDIEQIRVALPRSAVRARRVRLTVTATGFAGRARAVRRTVRVAR
jgi:streptogramin lyase